MKLARLSLTLLLCVGCSGVGSTAQAFDTETRLGRVNAHLWSQASDYEQSAMADGVVTFAEYEAAKLAAMACAREQGAEVDGPHRHPNGYFLSYDYVGDYGDDDDAHWDFIFKVDEKCGREYHWVLDQVWREQNMPTEAERLELVARLVECLENEGIEGLRPDMDQDAIDEEFYRQTGGHGGGLCFVTYDLAFATPFDPGL